MATVVFSPIANGQQFFGGFTAGSFPNVPLAGGLLWVYAAGTTTPVTTYTSSAGSSTNTNPIVLQSDGRPPFEIWWAPGASYKLVLQDPLGNNIPNGTYDNIPGINDGTLAGYVTTAALAAGNGATLVGYTPPGTGAVATTVAAELTFGMKSVFDFMTAAQISDVQARTLTQDVTAAVQAGITFCQGTGKILVCPAGAYKLTNQINVTGEVAVRGEGIYRAVATGVPAYGTVFVDTFGTGVAAYVFYCTGDSPDFRDLEVYCNFQPVDAGGWTPTATPIAFYCFTAPFSDGGIDPKFDNVMIRNMTSGIKMVGGQRGEINGLFGTVYGIFLSLDGIYDVARINNIHLNWPFNGAGTNQAAWLAANATGIDLGRVDNPSWSNIFVYGSYKAIQFRDSAGGVNPPGGVSRATWSNVGLDGVTYGILVNSTTYVHESDFTNLVIYANGNASSRCIFATGSQPILFKIANGDFNGVSSGSMAEAIRIEVSGSTLKLSNINVRSYNWSSGGFPAIYAGNGVTIQSGPYQINTSLGHSGAAWFNQGSATIDIAEGRVVTTTNPGYEQYTATIGGVPVTLYRQFGRLAFAYTSSPGAQAWSVTLPVAITTTIISARVSGGGSLAGTQIMDVYDNTAFPLAGARTTVGGFYATSAANATYYIDWEVVGY